jgi:hypothetical protein
MSVTMATQGGRVHLEQFNMRLALNMAKIATGGILCTTIEEMHFLNKKAHAEVRKETMRAVELPWHKKVKAAIGRKSVMLCQNQSPGYLLCHNCTANNPQTHARRKGEGAPPPNRCRQQTAEPNSPLLGTPPPSTGNTSRAQRLKIINLPAGYAYSHTCLPCAESFTLDASV